MAVSPSGIISEPLDKLADLIAACTTFQTWTGTANTAAAKLRIYPVATPSATRPCAILKWESMTVRRGGYIDGIMRIVWEAEVSSTYSSGSGKNDDTSAAYEFTNSLGVILAEMMQDAEDTSGTLYIPYLTGIRSDTNPLRRSGPTGLDSTTGSGKNVDYIQWHSILNWGIPAR